jgi:molecular chaperone GrpE
MSPEQNIHNSDKDTDETTPDASGPIAGESESAAVAATSEEPTGLTLAPESETPEARIAELAKERDALRDQVLRRRADFENLRKRVERERQQTQAAIEGDLVAGLLPVIDNLERALAAASSDDPLRQGVEMTLRDLLAFLTQRGIVVQEPLGQGFDPNVHLAVLHEEQPGAEEGQVIEVLRKGYVLKDRLIRPAWVKVAKGTADANSSTEATIKPEILH